MLRCDFLTLPVHSGRTFVEDLHPVHAEIAFPGSRIARGDAGESDEPSRILGPALQNREIEQREIVALDDFFTGTGGHRAREKLAGFGQQGKHLELVEEALRRFHIHEHADAPRDFVEGIDAQRQLHAGIGAELIDQDLRSGVALQILKEKRRPP